MARSAKARKRSAPAPVVHLGDNNYGKSLVRMVKVARAGRRHTVTELSIDIALQGDFDAIHTRGDNRKCLPTDTMKNTVYALGKKHPLDTIESFAAHLGRHFVYRNPQVGAATVNIAQVPWKRVRVNGAEHPHTFIKGSAERQTCTVTTMRDGGPRKSSARTFITSGIADLVILKSTDSGFSGFLRDEFTTLPDTDDRIFATSLSAWWNYASDSPEKLDHARCRELIRETMIATFAAHKSRSVQQTLYAMGQAALRACPHVDQIRLSMPNKHCLLVNLKPFGMTNRNEIFVPTDEPHGLIEATIERN